MIVEIYIGDRIGKGMMYILIAIICLLIGIIIIQLRSKTKRNHELHYMTQKLNNVIENQTSENY